MGHEYSIEQALARATYNLARGRMYENAAGIRLVDLCHDP
jgi:hypothetical protein